MASPDFHVFTARFPAIPRISTAERGAAAAFEHTRFPRGVAKRRQKGV